MGMHIINNSSIPAELVVDLRFDEDKQGDDDEKDGLDCLDIVCDEKSDESILHPIEDNTDE